MWISKKKLYRKLDDAKFESYMNGLNEEREADQWKRIYKLEQQVKKLKKTIKEGY